RVCWLGDDDCNVPPDAQDQEIHQREDGLVRLHGGLSFSLPLLCEVAPDRVSQPLGLGVGRGGAGGQFRAEVDSSHMASGSLRCVPLPPLRLSLRPVSRFGRALAHANATAWSMWWKISLAIGDERQTQQRVPHSDATRRSTS